VDESSGAAESRLGRLDERYVADARVAAAELLSAHSDRIYEIAQDYEQASAPDLAMHVSIARVALEAISDPPARLNMTCPCDGTPVIYDIATGKYCCAERHCPPIGGPDC
jgi:hypothetical protein